MNIVQLVNICLLHPNVTRSWKSHHYTVNEWESNLLFGL